MSSEKNPNNQLKGLNANFFSCFTGFWGVQAARRCTWLRRPSPIQRHGKLVKVVFRHVTVFYFFYDAGFGQKMACVPTLNCNQECAFFPAFAAAEEGEEDKEKKKVKISQRRFYTLEPFT